MATPNYGFEKRQRELAKKQKKEEKLRAKADRKAAEAAGETVDEHMPLADEAQGEEQPGESASASG